MANAALFPLADVLSLVVNRQLVPQPALLCLLNHLTADTLHPCQIARVRDECAPWLVRWCPRLRRAQAALPGLIVLRDMLGPGRGLATWLADLRAEGLPAVLAVPRIPQDDHQRIDPLEELLSQRCPGGARVLLLPRTLDARRSRHA